MAQWRRPSVAALGAAEDTAPAAFKTPPPGLLYVEDIEANGPALFRASCDLDLEGVIAKYRRGPYTSAPLSWFKILNPDYSQKRGRKEMFEAFHDRSAISADVHR